MSFGRVAAACLSSLAAACSVDESTNAVPANGLLAEYPLTGVTRELSLTVREAKWEVGPGAILDAITYDGQVPGPTIEVDAGDRVLIHLENETDEPRSIHTHVVRFAKDSDGTGVSVVGPGETKTIEWLAVFAGTFPYHDHAHEAEGIQRGLFGALVVHAPNEAPAREQLVVLADFAHSDFDSLPGVADPETGEFPDAGTYHGGHQYMHTINGKGYEDAVPFFQGKVGEISRWRIVSIGSEFHTWHIHGHRWVGQDGVLTDNVQLGPGMYTTFEFLEDAPGDWLVHCHVPDHMEGGMLGSYQVAP